MLRKEMSEVECYKGTYVGLKISLIYIFIETNGTTKLYAFFSKCVNSSSSSIGHCISLGLTLMRSIIRLLRKQAKQIPMKLNHCPGIAQNCAL